MNWGGYAVVQIHDGNITLACTKVERWLLRNRTFLDRLHCLLVAPQLVAPSGSLKCYWRPLRKGKQAEIGVIE